MRFCILLLTVLGLAIYAFKQMPDNEQIIVSEKIPTRELSIATIKANSVLLEKPKPPKKKPVNPIHPQSTVNTAIRQVLHKPTSINKKVNPQKVASKLTVHKDHNAIVIEQMPYFKGCSSKLSPSVLKSCAERKLLRYLNQNIQYPSSARIQRVEGIVYVQFIVTENGKITQATLMRDIGYGCGEEALRVVKSMPQWEPGKRNGKPVSVRFNLPVKFQMN